MQDALETQLTSLRVFFVLVVVKNQLNLHHSLPLRNPFALNRQLLMPPKSSAERVTLTNIVKHDFITTDVRLERNTPQSIQLNLQPQFARQMQIPDLQLQKRNQSSVRVGH